MIKNLFLIVSFLLCVSAFAQGKDIHLNDETTASPQKHSADTALLSYYSPQFQNSEDNSTEDTEFYEVVLFISSLGIDVIEICEEDALIMLILNEKWTDVKKVIEEVRKTYGGSCYNKYDYKTFYSSSCGESLKKKEDLKKK